MTFINTLLKFSSLLIFLLPLTGCFWEIKSDAQIEENVKENSQIPAVDVIKVTRGFLSNPREYIGTTQPIKEIILRSQAQGQILIFKFNVGDRVSQGQLIAQLDDTLLKASLYKAETELASFQSAVVEAQANVISAQAEVKSAQARFTQAQVDANRLEELYNNGAIAKRDVELAITEAEISKQAVKSAESQVKVKKATVETAKGRIISQKAVIEEEKKKLIYTKIIAPTNGYILQKLTEEGNLIQPGGEIITIGDFSQVKVNISVSELELKNIKLGNTVNVSLDAFPQQKFTGIINRISPLADSEGRQIPVEILLDNQEQKINSGLLARVLFINNINPPILIPESALEIHEKSGENTKNIVFILDTKNNPPQIIAKQVTLGKSQNGKIEVLTGLNEKDSLIIRSTNSLKHGEKVRLSAISPQ